MSISIKNKKFIDYFLGGALVRLMALIGIFFKFGKSLGLSKLVLGKPEKAILVMKFQGIGSLLLAKPGLKYLREKYPEHQIIFLGTPSTVSMAKLMPEFDDFEILNDRSLFTAAISFLNYIFRRIRKRPEVCFDLEVYSRLTGILSLLSFSTIRVGFAVDVVSFRRYLYTKLMLFNRYNWLGTAYAQLFSVVMKNPDTLLGKDSDLYGNFTANTTALPQELDQKNYIVINPHSGDVAPERRWEPQRFAQLISKISEFFPDHWVVIIGSGPREVAVSKSIVQSVANSNQVIDLTGKLKLNESINVIANSRLMVTGDSGPMHMALATKTPIVAFFGPTRPETYFPKSNLNRIIFKDIYCSPCVHHWEPAPCLGNNVCIKDITVNEVFTEIVNLVTKLDSGTKHVSYAPVDIHPRHGIVFGIN